jgi:hypothetical protein
LAIVLFVSSLACLGTACEDGVLQFRITWRLAFELDVLFGFFAFRGEFSFALFVFGLLSCGEVFVDDI